ncbi:MAG TPA: sulfate adenylyltransferase [Epulopiscium sp.]|nr:sulfate adenylyltransferase [Candidatus Epulonipiscium sp.]
MKQLKENLNIVVVGHVDHGKSTVIGRLLHDTNSLPQGAIDKVKNIAKETGKPFEYAYLLDAFEEEQKQGITIDTTQIQFHTKTRDYVIIDAPGHKEFLKNMITGAAHAQAALLVIDAKEGVQEQSKRHAYMLSLLGIQKVYIIINKMDLVGYSEATYKLVKKEMEAFLSELGIKPLKYIPVSAFYGENILQPSKEMPWYTEEALLDAMDIIETEKSLEGKSLRFPIQDVYKFDDRRIISGRIESGTLEVGDDICIYPEGKTTQVKTIEYWADRDKTDKITAGQSVGITVTDEFFNKRGEVITHISDKPLISNTFRASVFWMGKNPLITGKEYKIKLATQEVTAEIIDIIKVIDASSLEKGKKADKINLNDVAEVIISTKEKVAFDLFNNSHITGRFVIVDGYDVAGGGIIVKDEQAYGEHSISLFKEGSLEARAEIFDTFYYDVKEYNVKRISKHKDSYGIGYNIPLEGSGYKYPDHFDILVLRDQIAVKIRNGKVANICPIKEYHYASYPVLNGRGFGVKINSNEELALLLKQYETLDVENETDLIDFSNQWLLFDLYRRLTFNIA